MNAMHRLLCLGAVLLAPALAAAQVNPTYADLTGAVEEARTLIQTERKLVVRQAMGLTPAEEAAFWPVYDQYAADYKKVTDRRIKLITDYAANYDQMSDEVAKQLLKDGLGFNEDLSKLHRKYVKKFEKVLPPTKVARFYQVENKLDAITAFALAREVPLVPPAAAPVSQPR